MARGTFLKEFLPAAGLGHEHRVNASPPHRRVGSNRVLRLSCAFAPLLAFLPLLGCSTQPPSATGVALARPSQPYVRIDTNEPGTIKLEIAVRQFVPTHGKGPAIWLMGVSHIGDSNYYALLQRQLDAQTLVLFEGISGAPAPDSELQPQVEKGAEPHSESAAVDRSSLQLSLAASLGLVFQLTAIDYRRPNFRNSDLTVPELRQLLTTYKSPSGQTAAGERFEGVLQMMEGGSFLDSLIQMGLRFLSVSPKLQALGRLALIDVIGDIQGDLAQLQGLPPDMRQLLEVLLQRRNEKVMSDLKTELHGMGRRGSLAVFYGTGHMPDLEKRLRQDLKYRPETQAWLTAFSVDLAKSGVSDAERVVVQTMIRQQLGQFRAR